MFHITASIMLIFQPMIITQDHHPLGVLRENCSVVDSSHLQTKQEYTKVDAFLVKNIILKAITSEAELN